MSGATLPGTLPGLLRRGSPVVDHEGNRGAVVNLVPGGAHYAVERPDGQFAEAYARSLAGLSLDLTDATGRAHAAWWADAWSYSLEWRQRMCDASNLFLLARAGRNMTDADVERLRDLCLALGGAS